MSPFETAPEFIGLDNRQYRAYNPVSAEQMHKKHEVLFPESLVRGKTILDLGCCLGATGHWCLSKGAAHYTGVEVQDTYARTAEQLLDTYHRGKFSIEHSSIEDWLDRNTAQFSIVSILGVIYAFVDYYSILSKIAARAKETILVEGLYHNRVLLGEDFCGVEFRTDQGINLADEHAVLRGRGIRISPKGLEWLVKSFSFRSEGLLLPEPIKNSPDIYNVPPRSSGSARYLMKFARDTVAAPSLSEDLQGDRVGLRGYWRKNWR